MVQKHSGRPGPGKRGRPRAYDPDTALARATAAFWQGGYAGTSLDALAAATGMNRPSLYGAFGDKQALYLAAVQRYHEQGRAAMREALETRPLRAALAAVYARAAQFYLAGEHGQRGCFLIGTALTEAVNDPALRATLEAALDGFDATFAARFRAAREEGELPAEADPQALARIAAAVMFTMSIRARAGSGPEVLDAIAAAGITVLLGKQPVAGEARPCGKSGG